MIGKLIAVIIVFVALFFSLSYLYQNLPQDPIKMTANTTEFEPTQIIDYGATPVFAENLRFNHNNISYSIEPSCSEVRITAMREAFGIFEEKMKVISFREVAHAGVPSEEGKDGEADIMVGCSDEFIELGEHLFAAGEGGPSEIINMSHFKVIQKGKILLYRDPQCDRPVVELHELLHVFGFDHTSDPKSLMYNTTNCDQKITIDMIDLIKRLYSINPLPDARISELSASKKGIYLDFNITILNEGLTGIENINLSLIANGKEIDTIIFDEIGIGYKKTLRVTDMKLPSRNIETIDFVIDYKSMVEELNEDNNLVQMTIMTS